ncbi:NADPH-dependent F420 reductase [Arthrobacter sp. B0490]|uniref:NADPH-dependent F420 reductase n=1 Tax=Arthrobacter sp. B0490 TaxID=2058891 RepID=UPI000CE404EE|nr:NAD(P)-binding domain-containing protein [Arthrobacter sp. B0490]
MKIGILGAGAIGSTLALKLAAAGHNVKVANSRGPRTIDPDILVTGAAAVEAVDLVDGIEVLITSVPLSAMPALQPLVTKLPTSAAVIDTSNYYPMRDGHIHALDNGQVESLWVVDQLGRPVAKAWNSIVAGSFATKGTALGTSDRLALPVAADRETDKTVALSLVKDTGFDAFDAGSLADSWRQQPGAPAYCTDLTLGALPDALAAAKKDRIPQRRDIAMATIGARVEAGTIVTANDIVDVNRATYN